MVVKTRDGGGIWRGVLIWLKIWSNFEVKKFDIYMSNFFQNLVQILVEVKFGGSVAASRVWEGVLGIFRSNLVKNRSFHGTKMFIFGTFFKSQNLLLADFDFLAKKVTMRGSS